MPKSKNKRKSGSGKKGTVWGTKVARRMVADNQRRIDDERNF